MRVNFDEPVDRRNTHSYKWTVDEGELPMWVADMDFKTAPAVSEALKKRLAQDAFGYNIVPESFNQSIVDWWERRHQFEIDPEWILFCTGVVPAISSIVRKLTTEADQIVLLTPVYNIFFNSILNNQRTVLASELLYDGEDYQINFADLEEKLSREETTLLIFCNPHNPIGKVWDFETLKRVGDLCVQYDVRLLSDEIHCDLTHPGNHYTPMASISEEISQTTITCVAATKAFNFAGLQSAAIIIQNPVLRKLVNRGINTDEVAEPNTFAIQATIAAFDEGEEWLTALNEYLAKNRVFIETYIQKNIPDIKLIKSEATYLAWLDCSKLSEDTTEVCQFIREKTGLYLSEGELFSGNGAQFIRLNYACPMSTLEDGLGRFERGIRLYREEKSRKIVK